MYPTHLRLLRHTLCASLTALVSAGALHAQACNGTPAGGFWVERGELVEGNTLGGGVSAVGRHFGFTAGFRHHDVNDALSGNEAEVRAAIVLRASAVQICPVIGLEAAQEDWDAPNGVALKSTRAAAGAGVGIGIPLRVMGDFSLIPHAIGQYEYSGTYFSIDGGNGEKDESAATGGRLDFEFGLLARFKLLYVGFRSNWSPETKNAYLNRWIAGVAL